MNLQFLIILISVTSTSGTRIMCYYPNWAQYRVGKYKMLPENIDPTLCTHIVYAFAWIRKLNVVAVEGNDIPRDRKLGMYQRVMKLKEKNPNLKVLITISGGPGSGGGYHKIVNSSPALRVFVRNALTFVQKHGFDGIDLNWLYPSVIAVPTITKHQFTLIIRMLRNTLDYYTMSPKQHLLLCVSLSGLKYIIDAAYELANIVMYADFINVMAYDYHGPWEGRVEYSAPTFGTFYNGREASFMNTDRTLYYYLLHGVPKEKINIGVPFFARTYTLKNSSFNTIGSLAIGPGRAGPNTHTRGFMSLDEYSDLTYIHRYTLGFEPYTDNSYRFKGDQWASGNDDFTLGRKFCYAKRRGFGGVAVRSIDLDRFIGNQSIFLHRLIYLIKSENQCNFIYYRDTLAAFTNTHSSYSCSRCISGDHPLLLFFVTLIFNCCYF